MRTIQNCREKPWRLLWALRCSHQRNVFYYLPPCRSHPLSFASWSKRWYVLLEAEALAVFQQCTKLSPPLVLCKTLWFEEHYWNVKHYCHSSKNIHVHLLTHYFLSGAIEIHTKQFHPPSKLFLTVKLHLSEFSKITRNKQTNKNGSIKLPSVSEQLPKGWWSF
jgi:hypothetical protein